MSRWQDKESLTALIKELVEIPSISTEPAEIAMAEHLYYALSSLDYYKDNPGHLQLQPMPDGRKLLTAFVQNGPHKDTVVLLSHFDVVNIEDYGDLKHLAFRPAELTEQIEQLQNLPDDLMEDMENEQWLFGRGTMDMKAGVALHLSMIEKAAEGHFPGNILMVSVPDEEVNSAGMLAAIPVLEQLKKQFSITYKACLNGEPAFTRYPGDKNHYLYTGTVGKVLPGFLCYGRETHVGEPFGGLNGNLMAAEITRLLELNLDFCETLEEEAIPPPANLLQKDLKDHYSVQIPHAAVTMFNLLLMEKSFTDVNQQLLELAKEAAEKVESFFYEKALAYSKLVPFDIKKPDITVLTFQELYERALELHGQEEITRRENYILSTHPHLDDRDVTTMLVNDLASLCKQYAPMIVLFYAPPFYPAVSSREDAMIQKVSADVIQFAQEQFQITLKKQNYFAGLSDLSYVGLSYKKEELRPLLDNMPVYGERYTLPLNEMNDLTMPVMNLGPLGRDAHKWTERLHLSSLQATQQLIAYTITKLLKG
ncbi:M20/M25/M40 family metallo-hydrolase [Fictibacillus fluitans]|uniref:M20/M25/M40 family metallo-hydrolase n=1 Tax=Fictibacillus fluitans TaxID=3058422 RepID=A0ABT8HXU5_9BACL|nr:M20/M25/M40 family metallo-hydrolase [Fictibacillus sp. NE201]MDN4525596.1 M20/M25/M40 family metallo-hydrolase [Fictibacillus sp. NE201]